MLSVRVTKMPFLGRACPSFSSLVIPSYLLKNLNPFSSANIGDNRKNIIVTRENIHYESNKQIYFALFTWLNPTEMFHQSVWSKLELSPKHSFATNWVYLLKLFLFTFYWLNSIPWKRHSLYNYNFLTNNCFSIRMLFQL